MRLGNVLIVLLVALISLSVLAAVKYTQLAVVLRNGNTSTSTNSGATGVQLKECRDLETNPLAVNSRILEGRSQLCAGLIDTDIPVACMSPYGALLPAHVASWGKQSVDWSTKTMKHMFWGEPRHYSSLSDHHLIFSYGKQCPDRVVIDEEYYERGALTHAALEASELGFVMFELGGGTCRWSIDAFRFLQANRPKVPSIFQCVEADPLTVEYARGAFSLNGIPQSSGYIYHGAVSTSDGESTIARKNNALSYGGGAQEYSQTAPHSTVPTFSILTLLSQFWLVDHMDFDCQDCERVLFSDNETLRIMTDRVKSIWVETHSFEAHDAVTGGFSSYGWTNCPIVQSFSGKSETVDHGQGNFETQANSGAIWCLNPHFDEM